MNSGDIIVIVKSIKDIEKITGNAKYINLSVDGVQSDVIDFFLLNGASYSYSDAINDRNGFIYASYDMFKDGEIIINNIIDNMPLELSDLEKVRYIYIALGKILSCDINIMEDKNEKISFSMISTTNNVWGALSRRKCNEVTISKIFMYVCSRIGIKSELVSSSIKGNLANKVYLDNSFLVVDLFNDLCNIQSGFTTKHFDKYNDHKEMDKKILYIKDEYMNFYIDGVLKNIDYTAENIMEDILLTTGSILNINAIGPYELYKIYRDIFDKYLPNYNININNLYVGNGLDIREHFIVFNYGDNYYSYNYNKGTFMKMDIELLIDNIKSNKIGVYGDENFVLKERSVVL